MSIKHRINILNIGGLLFLGILSVLITLWCSKQNIQKELSYIRNLMIEERKTQLNDLIYNAYAAVANANFWSDGQRTVNAMRFGADKKNYFFVMDTDGMIYVHPEKPALVGKVQLDLEDADSRKIIKEMVEIAKNKGEGFIEYRWPKPGTENPVRKLTYVKLFKDWRWVICTGIYLDDIEQVIAAKESELSANMKVQIKYQTGLIAAILALVILTSTVIARRISEPIAHSIKTITDVSVQVASASDQVFASSRDLSKNTSDQTEVIKHSKNSLKQIIENTHQNVGYAEQVNSLMTKTSRVLNQTEQSLSSLDESIKEMSDSGHETRKIVEHIDKLSFKIRIVALNAAIEAARIGETGAGFAVIADEIKKLADYSAEAAKNTASHIEAAVIKLNNGSDQLNRTKTAFHLAFESVQEVGQLIGNITTASNRQHREIEQIRKSAAVMGRVAEQNSTTAEESALAAESMKKQADQMNRIVGNLVCLVKGTSRNGNGKSNGNGNRRFFGDWKNYLSSLKPLRYEELHARETAILNEMRLPLTMINKKEGGDDNDALAAYCTANISGVTEHQSKRSQRNACQ